MRIHAISALESVDPFARVLGTKRGADHDEVLCIVLKDGETFGPAEGCALVAVPKSYDGDYEDMEEYVVSRFVARAPYFDFTDVAIPSDYWLGMLLDDGETCSAFSGCTLVEVPSSYDGEDPLADGYVVMRFDCT
jgi:hypothetical protein